MRETAEAPLPAPPGSVLLVQNNPVSSAKLREAAGEAFPAARVFAANSLGEARAQLVALPAELVVIDLNIAELGLGEFMDDVRRLGRPTRVVVVAGHAGDDRILPALRAGVAGFLLKYDPHHSIEAQLRESVAGGVALSPQLARQIVWHFDWTGLRDTLTPAEVELLTWVAAGDTLDDVAGRMRAERAAVSAHVRMIFEKVGRSASRASRRRVGC